VKDDYTQYKYEDALIPQTYTICGIILKPFCLGHIMLLERINNPFISAEEQTVSKVDGLYYFFLALLICGHSFEDGKQLLDDIKLLEQTAKAFCDNLIVQMGNEPEWNYFSKFNMFKAYMKYYLDMPFYDKLNSETGGNPLDNVPSGTDWKNSIFITFKKLGYTQTQIVNMSLKKLFYEWTAYAESEGAIKVANKYDHQAMLNVMKGKK
jgi:hypothetical protein